MKKFRILMGVLALAMAAIVIVACTKEKEMRSEMVENIETVSKEDDMNAYLKQFKERMQSASRGDETLSMEDARWHLEAVLNYTYGDVGRQISDIQYDTLYYNLHTDGNELTLAQLNDAFIVLSYDLEKTYENCDLPDKSILAIQTTFENKSKGDVVVKSIISTRGYIAYPFPILFDSTDYWWEDDYSGKCGPYVGTCIGYHLAYHEYNFTYGCLHCYDPGFDY